MDAKTLAEKLNGNYTKGQIDGELIKYLVIPGHVRAADGDIHFISAEMLIDLYRVDPSRCVIYDANLAKKIGTGAYWRVNEKIFSNLIMLKPKPNGNYSIDNVKN